MGRILTVILALGSAPALAHGGGEILLPGDFWTEWHADPAIVLLLAVAIVAYWRGYAADRRGVRPALRGVHLGSFLAGIAMLAASLLTPLESLSGTLFSAHTLQHLMLIAVAPPLLVAGRPDIAILRGAAPGLRRALGRAANRGIAAWVVRPLPAALLHAFVLWAWHIPPLFDAALVNESLHALEHLTFFASALLFWVAVARSARANAAALAGLVAIVITLILGGLLGALITLAPQPIYAAYGDAPLSWGISPILDQQLGGLMMWVPGSLIYLLAGLAIAVSLMGRPREGREILPPR